MWINENKRQQFDGVLVVVDHHLEKGASAREALVNQVADAHAGGMAVVYAFNAIEDICLPGDDVEWLEEMDFLRPLKGASAKELADEAVKELKPRYDDVRIFMKGKLL